MSKGGPDLKKYMDKRLAIKLNANRNVVGILRGFDQVHAQATRFLEKNVTSHSNLF